MGDIAGAGIGMGMGLAGTILTNESNASNVAATNAQSAANVQSQENFAESMADTQYQRGVTDLKAAGLNPMLAYMNSAAPSPQGSVAPVQTPQVQNVLGAGVNSGMDAMRLEQQMKSTDAQTKLATQQANLTETKIPGEMAASAAAADEARMTSNQRTLLDNTFENRLNAAKLNSQKDLQDATSNLKYQGADQFSNRVSNYMGTVNSAGQAASKVSPLLGAP